MTSHALSFTHRVSRVVATAALALVALAGGCASLDPSPDLRRAGAVVGDRSGLPVDWTVPWADRNPPWDGRSPLSMEQAATTALMNNRALRSQVEQIAAGRADLVQAGLLPNPVLALALRFPADPVAGYSQVGATVVQDLVSLWLRPSRIRVADARLNETVLSVSDSALRLVANVKASHARVVFGQRAVALTRENIAMVERSVLALQDRVRGGESTPLDPNRARQQLLSLRADLALQERELAKERRRLLLLIGHAGDDATWSAVEEHHDDHPVHRPQLPRGLDESAVAVLATSQRLDVAAARAVVEARAAELSEQERSRIKSLGLGVAFEQTEDKKRFVGPDVEVAIPIFDLNQAQIAKAGSLARASLAAFEDTAQRAVAAARVAFVEAQSTEAIAAEFRRDLIPLAETNLHLASRSVAAGQDDVTVLLESQRGVIEARIRLNELERDAALARIELEYAVGGRLSETERREMSPHPVEGGGP